MAPMVSGNTSCPESFDEVAFRNPGDLRGVAISRADAVALWEGSPPV